MAYAYHLDVLFPSGEELAYGLGLYGDGARRSFLYKDVAILSMLEREQHQVDSLVEAHDEARHSRLGDSDRISRTNLLNPQRDNRAARTHHIAIARTADFGLARIAALGHGNFLLDGLGDTHRVDRIGGLIG